MRVSIGILAILALVFALIGGEPAVHNLEPGTIWVGANDGPELLDPL